MRSLAWLFTAGEAALYFVRVDECFGTVGGGGAEGNKSGVGRAGWREARVRASRSSCQPLGPAPGRERPGRPGPQTVISAPGQTASNPTRRQHPVLRCEDLTAALLRLAVSRRRIVGTTATGRTSKPKFRVRGRGRLGPCGADLGLRAGWNPY